MYKWNKKYGIEDEQDGIEDEQGWQILQLVPVHCSEKFREIAGKLLVVKLNELEIKREVIKEIKQKSGGRANAPRADKGKKPEGS